MISAVIAGSGAALSGLVLAFGLWWTGLCVLAIPRPRARTRTIGWRVERLVVLVPAHNEETLIGPCVSSIRRSAARARQTIQILVVADNCSDDTAIRAREAGAFVLQRRDSSHRGKPYALEYGLGWLARRPAPDAVFFVDADCAVDPDCITHILNRLASGGSAVQAHYRGAAGNTSVEGLRRLALYLVNWSRPLGASRLGAGATIKGSGMALRWELLREGLGAFSVAEDAEMTLNLCRRGVKVEFEPRALVTGRMAATLQAARTQDRRWESGRLTLAPRALTTAIWLLLRGRIRLALAAAEVAAPPLTASLVLALVAAGLATAGFGPLWLAGLSLGSILTYVAVGLVAARASRDELSALLFAPRFVAYKVVLLVTLLLRGKQVAWERTSRD